MSRIPDHRLMTAVIIEDEPAGRKILQRLIADHCPEVKVVEAVGSTADGRKAIAHHKPQLVFLDVEMPGESGIEMLRNLAPVDFHVIFTTAHEGYAVEAIRLSAIDYLLKPVLTEELIGAVRKVREREVEADRLARLEALLHNLGDQDLKIGVVTRKGIIFLRIEEIVRCRSESNYTRIHLVGEASHLSSKTLRHFEDLLAKHDFIRVHQSHLVNVRFIREYLRGDGGTLLLTDGSSVEVSRRFKEQVVRRFGKP